jgi:hypothetical protein
MRLPSSEGTLGASSCWGARETGNADGDTAARRTGALSSGTTGPNLRRLPKGARDTISSEHGRMKAATHYRCCPTHRWLRVSTFFEAIEVNMMVELENWRPEAS